MFKRSIVHALQCAPAGALRHCSRYRTRCALHILHVSVSPHAAPNPPVLGVVSLRLPPPRRLAAGTLAAMQGEARRLPEVAAAERAYRERAESHRKVRRRRRAGALWACTPYEQLGW